MADLIEALREVVGPAHVLTDDDLTTGYRHDWTGRFSGQARCVVRPADADQVSAVLTVCSAAGAPVAVQGGNTGLVGGGVPTDGDVLVSTTRLTSLGPVDPVAGQVTAGAGVSLASLQAHARSAGFDFGVDLASRDTATVGGLVATNAGGVRVLRHGDMRAQVAGLAAVLADGSVLAHLSGLTKDNTGYDLTGLLTGSEGTLAILTEVRLRLVRPLQRRAVALVGTTDAAGALRVLDGVRERGLTLCAAELCYADGLALVRRHTGLQAPLATDCPAYLLIECDGRTDPTDELAEALGEVDAVIDATIAADTRGREQLWRYREAHTESINAAGVPIKLDVSVPLGRLTELADRMPAAVAGVTPDARTILFGHVNEGNLHVNVLGAVDDGEPVTDAVLRLVAELGGSISAEHGIGRAKVGWLGLCRSPAEIATMRAVKSALDPDGLLGRGVLFATTPRRPAVE